jgi:hypothetical protein
MSTARESTAAMSNLAGKLSALGAVVAFVLGGGIVGSIVNLQNSRTEERKASAAHIEILSKPEAPVYARVMALSSLLHYELVDTDIIVEAGFDLEREYGPGALRLVLYEIGRKRELLSEPIGYVDFPGMVENDSYRLYGWAIDKQAVASVQALLDDDLVATAADYGSPRRDIGLIFAAYPNAGKSGFSIVLPKSQFVGREGLLTIRVRNRGEAYRDIKVLVKFNEKAVSRVIKRQ